jgi:hypothetical protein
MLGGGVGPEDAVEEPEPLSEGTPLALARAVPEPETDPGEEPVADCTLVDVELAVAVDEAVGAADAI